MKDRILKLTKGMDLAFLRASSIVFIGAFIVNILNYLFSIIIGRMLGPVGYGEVAALFSFFIIVGVPGATISMFMAKQSARYKGQGRMSSVQHLMAFLDTYSLIFGVGLWVVFLVLMPAISAYLAIGRTTLFIFSLLVPLSLVSAVSTGALQGLAAFVSLQKQNIGSATLKLVAAVALVLLGWSVNGVIIALVLATVWSLIYGFIKTVYETGPMGFFSAHGESDADWASLKSYFLPVLAVSVLLAVLSNIDVVMAKHYLTAFQAGQYGALSTIGKILLYSVGALTTVLLPIASEAHAKGTGRDRTVLLTSLGIVSVVSVAVIAVFWLVPTLVVHLLFGAAYLGIAPYLATFGLVMYFVAVTTVFVNYFIATHAWKFIYPFAVAIIGEIAFISARHGSIGDIVGSLVTITGILAVYMTLRYFLDQYKLSHA